MLRRGDRQAGPAIGGLVRPGRSTALRAFAAVCLLAASCGAARPEAAAWWRGLESADDVTSWAPAVGKLGEVVRKGVRAAGLRAEVPEWVEDVHGPVVVASIRLEGPRGDRLAIEQRLQVTHPGGAAWDKIVLRWYGAGERRAPELSWPRVLVDGAPAEATREGTLLTLVPAEPIEAGETVDVVLSLAATVPDLLVALPDRGTSNTEDHGLYGRWGDTGEINLAFVLPQLTHFDGEAWDERPLPATGEHVDLDMQDVLLVLEHKASLTPVVGGVQLLREVRGGQARSVHALPLVRDTSLVLSPAWTSAEVTAGDRLVRAHVPSGWDAGWEAAEVAQQAMDVWSLLDLHVGVAPWRELDLVGAPGRSALASELSTLVLLHPRQRNASPSPSAVVAHEVAHQWWYGVVGSDAHGEPWVDEAVASWTSAWAIGVIEGERARADSLQHDAFFAMLREPVPRPPATLPASAYTTQQYGAAVYGRATLFFEELARVGGDDRMIGALRRWYRERAGGRGTGEELMALLREVFGDDQVTQAASIWLDGFTPLPASVAPGSKATDPVGEVPGRGGRGLPGGGYGSGPNKGR